MTKNPEYTYEVQGNYGQGFECVTAEELKAEALARLKEYRENCPEYPHRLRKVKNS